MGYRAADGQKVVSVTTVISKFKEAGGLMHWAWKEGIEGRDYRETRDKAADAGSLGHAMIENWAKGLPVDDIIGPEDVLGPARQGFHSFLAWAASTKLQIVAQEVSLVSEKYRFAGCLDSTLVVVVDGALSMGDWKFSNSVYSEYMIQLAAYGLLWEENNPDQPLTGGFHLMRFSKEFGDFSHRHWPELERAKRAFLLMRELYDIKGELDKRVK